MNHFMCRYDPGMIDNLFHCTLGDGESAERRGAGEVRR